ncbi:MAG: hypothetical protein AAF749_07860 [Pseudomonadota bacterium]
MVKLLRNRILVIDRAGQLARLISLVTVDLIAQVDDIVKIFETQSLSVGKKSKRQMKVLSGKGTLGDMVKSNGEPVAAFRMGYQSTIQ